ncbi:MAG: methyltransferase domain-containing protein [Candidatus Alcyoniella australis]|nr:methyltransferase domain-containing protein [Candidatus Alcyoniella australis]
MSEKNNETIEESVDLQQGEHIEKFLHGKVRIVQKQDGYRFSIDPILLCGFVDIKPDDVVADLGTGSGVMPIILASQGQGAHSVGIEIQPSLVDQAQRSAKLNGFEDRIEIVEGDYMHIRNVCEANEFDAVISNPPYIRQGGGRIPSDEQKAIARHEISMDLGGMAAAAAYLLKPGGRAYFVYTTTRLVDMLQTCRQHDLEPRTIQMVHNNENTRAKLVLVEAVNGGGVELNVLKPLFVYNLEGDYTDEVNGFLEEKPGL